MKIDSARRCVLMGMLVIATSLAVPANAAPHGGGYRGGVGWWGLALGLGLGWEAARISGPYYVPVYPVYYYPAPQYYYPDLPPSVMIQMPYQGATTAAPPGAPSVPNWYYCPPAKGYYPYVRECPEAWRVVPATPPPPR
ncbi:hypothetical protein [Pseudomonas sp. MWU13-2105]|uniref:hypothetical protein n=1 Tax=Pseudomonas sp. MWU13-2105 TaxID=2935074 RepID=UPI00200DA920|nr:hypothetical protein [Pseudomonas sp. MWU13-2105]